MANRTLTAMYDSSAAAEDARRQLQDLGVAADSVRVSDEGDTKAAAEPSSGGIWSGLISMFMPEEERHLYHEGVKRGHYVLTAVVPDAMAERAHDLLDATEAVDVDERVAGWRESGWSGAPDAYGRNPKATHQPLSEGGAVFDDRPEAEPSPDDQGAPAEEEPTRVAPTLAQERSGEADALIADYAASERAPATGGGPGLRDMERGSGRVRSYRPESAMAAQDARTEQGLSGSTAAAESTRDTVRRGEREADDGRLGTGLDGETSVTTERLPGA